MVQSPALPHDDFAVQLTLARTRCGYSRNALAHKAGLDPSYLTRIESGQRVAPREAVVAALAAHLQFPTVQELESFYVAAGFAPPSLAGLGWDGTLSLVVRVLASDTIGPYEREHFRRSVQHLAALTVAASRHAPPATRTNGVAH